MEAIKLQKKIDSETIPELKRFLGKEIEIILLGIPPEKRTENKGNMTSFISAGEDIEIDESAFDQLRERSII